jgi:hypothetical protein
MAYNKDYIPNRDAEFGGWFENLTKESPGSWGCPFLFLPIFSPMV